MLKMVMVAMLIETAGGVPCPTLSSTWAGHSIGGKQAQDWSPMRSNLGHVFFCVDNTPVPDRKEDTEIPVILNPVVFSLGPTNVV